jgi:hypothetical protein
VRRNQQFARKARMTIEHMHAIKHERDPT